MKGFSKEVREAIDRGQRGYCAAEGCTKPIDDYHHMLHNTKTNRKLFPKFINSIWNCVGLCREDHQNLSHLWSISEDMAREYESALTTNYTEYTSD